MEDIVPGLLEKIQKQFDSAISKSNTIKKFKESVKKGKATYEQANEAAQEIGKILAKVYQNNISSGTLPDGRMYYNIASRILDPTLKKAYAVSADNAVAVQNIMNKDANIGIKTLRPDRCEEY